MPTTLHATHPGWGPLWRGLVSDPTAKHYKRLKNGCLWLFLYLVATVHPRTGKLVTTWTMIAEDTGLTREHIRSLAGHLRTKGYAHVVPHGDDQVLFVVHRWKPVHFPAQPAPPIVLPPNTTVTISPLATEIARALDADEHMDDILTLVREYPEERIRKHLESAIRVPQEKIKVSRWALFRWLLSHDHHEGTEEE